MLAVVAVVEVVVVVKEVVSVAEDVALFVSLVADGPVKKQTFIYLFFTSKNVINRHTQEITEFLLLLSLEGKKSLILVQSYNTCHYLCFPYI